MSCELKAMVRDLLASCEPAEPKLPGDMESRTRDWINKLQVQTQRPAGIPYWWWTPTGGKTLIANTFQTEGREHSDRWVNESRPALVVDKVHVTTSYELMNFDVHPLDAEVTVADWLKTVFDGPLYPPQGVEAFLREWSGAEAAA